MATPEPNEATGRRARGRPGYTRETVLRRAIDLFNESGYNATSINDIATDLGITKSAIYHHFGSKEDILAAALDEALEGLESTVQYAASDLGGESAGARLRSTIQAAIDLLAAHRPAVTLLLRVRGNTALERAAIERRRHVDESLTGLVQQAIDAGDLRADIDPEVVSRLIFGTINSLVEWYRPAGTMPAEHMGETVASVLFQGLDQPRPRSLDLP